MDEKRTYMGRPLDGTEDLAALTREHDANTNFLASASVTAPTLKQVAEEIVRIHRHCDGGPNCSHCPDLVNALVVAFKAAQKYAATGPGWQPIETAPKDGTAIDLWVREGGAQFRVIGARWMLGQWQCVARGSGQELWVNPSAPTHWMPIPEPPK